MSYTREEVDIISKVRRSSVRRVFRESMVNRDSIGRFAEKPGGDAPRSGERFRKPWPLGQMYSEHKARKAPGRGKHAKDDGVPGTTHIKMRSIENVPTARLERRRDHLVQQLRTPEGLRQWDDTRRALIEANMHLKAIEWELERRAKKPSKRSASVPKSKPGSLDVTGPGGRRIQLTTLGEMNFEPGGWNDKATIASVQDGLDRVAARFPKAPPLRTIGTNKEQTALGNKSNDTITVGAMFHDSDFWEQRKRDSWLFAGDATPGATIFHEYAHILDGALPADARADVDAIIMEPTTYEVGGKSVTLPRWQAGNYSEWKPPSTYAQESRYEFVAEALTDVEYNGDAATPTSKQIAAIFDRVYGGRVSKWADEVSIIKRGKSLARAAAASKQLRWPEGVDVAPNGKGPGGGRFRAGSAKRASAAMQRAGKTPPVDVTRAKKTAPSKPKSPAAPAKAALPMRAGKLSEDAKNPYFRALFRPIKPRKMTADFAAFREHHHARTSSAGVIEAGGKTHFRRFIPVGWKPGQKLKPPDAEGRGKYVAGEGMSLNEVGDMGEALAYYNPTIRGIIEKYYGGKMSEPEGFNMANGRAANSLFDAYVGQYGIEIKTLAVTGNRDKYKLPDFSEKLKLAQSKGIKPGYMFLMVDQQHGKVWLFATPKTKVLTSKNNNQSYSQMDMLTPAEGLDVGQDMMYAAWLYGSLERPIREGGDGNSVKGSKGKVTITGKPSKTRWGSGTKTAGSGTLAGAEALLHGNQWTGKFR